MAAQHIRLSKKIFMSLNPGQYLKDNYFPSKHEEITEDLASQWEKWRGDNGNVVHIFDSKEECLAALQPSDSINSINENSKAILIGKISKKMFMELKSGSCILFTQGVLEYFELNEDREKQWLECRHNNGRMVEIFTKINDLIFARNDIISRITQG